MSRNSQQSRKPVVTLEPMFLMSASAVDINVNADAGIEPAVDAGINPEVGPLPGFDFPGEWIVETFNADRPEGFAAFSLPSAREQQIAIDDSSSPPVLPSDDIERLEIFPDNIPADSADTAEDPFSNDRTSEPVDIPGAVPVPAKSVATLAFVSEGAGYRNTIGTYLVDEATGQISDVRIAFANASLKGSGGNLVRGDAVELEIAEGKQVGFFILADGDRQNDLEAVAGRELTFVVTKSSGTTLMAIDESGQRTALKGNLYFSDTSMNPNGMDHFKIEATDSGMLIQIEDLPNLGDKDYDDVVVELKFEAIELVAPEFTSLNGSATYIEGRSPVVLDVKASLNAAADALTGGTLTLQRAGGADVSDIFAGSGSLSQLAAGGELVVDGTSIGYVLSNDNGSLIVTLNENATTDLVNAALRQVTYSNSSDYISGQIDIAWSFVAGDESGTAKGSTTLRLVDSDRIYVTTSEREVDGDTSSIAALIANNGGTGISLEEAIIAANNTVNVDGADEIYFNIAGDGFHVIAGIGQPDITEAVTIDAATESDFTDMPLVVLDGNGEAGNAFTLTSSADGTEIRGFNIRDFAGNGIVIQAGSDDNIIANNWIGGLANDGSDAGADERIQGAGIVVFGAHNYIGGMSTSEANVISGNSKQGIRISGREAEYNVIQGNLIGTDKDGEIDLGNQFAGIRVDSGAVGTIIGGMDSGAGNILSGNGTFGVRITGEGTNDSVIQGNLIGTDHSGTKAIGNDVNGIRVDLGAKWTTIGGGDEAAGNVVSGNVQQGIRISGAGTAYTVIQGNVIGTDSDGSAALGNGHAGIRIDAGAKDTVVGGDFAGAGNIVSGNGAHGVRVNGVDTNDTTIQGNLIGTDATGTQAIGNLGVGILIDAGAQGTTVGGSGELAGNVVSANEQQGVRVSGEGTDDTVIQGNVIGTNSDGTAALGNKYAGIVIDAGARDSVVGGHNSDLANILSGNGTFGVRVSGENTDDTTIQGNLIGTDESGAAAIGNANNGVRIDSGAAGTTVGGTDEGAGNVISGNGTQGVRVTGEGTDFSVILGNVIGTDSNGLIELGNRHAGVLIDAGARGSVIGGSRAGSANILSGNGTYGIRITGEGTNDHTVQGNLIGTDHTASVAIGNANSGIRIDAGAQENTIGGSSDNITNVIAGNGGDGVRLDGAGTDNNVVQNNDIETQGTDTGLANARKGVFVGAETNNIVGINGEHVASQVSRELTELADMVASQGFDSADSAFNDIDALGSSLVQPGDSASSLQAVDDVSKVDPPLKTSGNLSDTLRTSKAAVFFTGAGTNVEQLAVADDGQPADNDATNPMLIVQDANTGTQQARSLNSVNSNKARSESESEPEKPKAVTG